MSIRTLTCLLLMLFCIPILYGQNIFEDKFVDNRNDWRIERSLSSRIYIEDGKYFLGNRRINNYTLSYKNIGIDLRRDFVIEAVIEQKAGSTEFGFGLVMGDIRNTNFYEFIISAEGAYKIIRKKRNDERDVVNWIGDRSIRRGRLSRNRFTLKKENAYLGFYINDKFLKKIPAESLSGNEVGFFLTGTQLIAVDDISVKYLGNRVTVSIDQENKEIREAQLPPIMSIEEVSLSKNILRAQESTELKVSLKNVGPGEARNVYVELSSETPGLSFNEKTEFSTIAAQGGEQSVYIPIRGEISLPTGEALINIRIIEPNFKVEIQGKQLRFPIRELLTPELILAQYAVVEHTSANPNNHIDLNEMIELKFAVQNIGKGSAEDIELQVSNSQTGVMFLGVAQEDGLKRNHPKFDEIIAGKYKIINYRYFVNSEFTQEKLSFSIQAKEKYGKHGFNEIREFDVNKDLEEEGYIRTVSIDEEPLQNEVLIEDIPTFEVDVDKNIPQTNYTQEHTYALIIGNEDYQSQQTGLSKEQNVDFALNDALVFSQYCERTLGIPPRHIQLLRNATAAQIKQGLAWIKQLADIEGGRAKLIFYYSGHGLPDENDKEPYLIPVDVSGRNLELGVKLRTVYEELTAFPAEQVSVFLDACFTGGARNKELIASRGIRIRPNKYRLSGNMVVFSSSSGEESSYAFPEKRHGMFTYYLLKKLQGTQGDVNLETLSEYVTQSVRKEAGLKGITQTPDIRMSAAVETKWKDWKLR